MRNKRRVSQVKNKVVRNGQIQIQLENRDRPVMSSWASSWTINADVEPAQMMAVRALNGMSAVVLTTVGPCNRESVRFDAPNV